MSERAERIAAKNAELLDAAKARLLLSTDYKLAQKMEVPNSYVVRWRKGFKLSNHALIWCAITLERPTDELIGLYEMAIAPESERAFWASFLSRCRRVGAALALVLSICSGITGNAPGLHGGKRRLSFR